MESKEYRHLLSLTGNIRWSAFLSVIQFVISPVILNGSLPSVQNGFRRHQCGIFSCFWIADKHCSDKLFLLDGDWVLDLLLLEVPLVS
jgi:hypothetical protein